MGAVEATMRVAASIEGLLRSLAKRRGVTSNRDMVEIDNAAKEFASLVARYTGDSSLVTNLLGWRSA
jgi:hypothetical protein